MNNVKQMSDHNLIIFK